MLIKNNIEISAIFIKKFTLKRFKNEFSRDGLRLIKKIWNKLILGQLAYKKNNADNIIKFRDLNDIKLNHVNELKKNNTKIFYVNDINSTYVEDEFKKVKPSLVLFTGGGIIRQNIINLSGSGVINCHMGVLPAYRGMDVVEWPILHGDFNNVGLTTHFMDSGIDTGPILKIKRVKIRKNESINNLRKRFEPLMVQLMLITVIDFSTKRIKPENQNFEDGKQYYIMHNDLKEICKKKLENIA